MDLNAAVNAANDAIEAVPEGGFTNGAIYINAAQLATSHIKNCMRWPYEENGTGRTLVDHIARYSSAHLSEDARSAATDKVDIETAVLVAIARLSAARFYGWTDARMSPAEVARVTNGESALTIHNDHQAEVAAAVAKMANTGPRMMALFYYNALSYEVCNHHHLPAVTKRLAKTTITMSGLQEWMEEDPDRESVVFHDMFHPLSDVEKSNAARRVAAKTHLANLKFDNIGKRLPVKAPDSGIAINFAVLVRSAKSFKHNPEDLPSELKEPANVAAAVLAYQEAQTPENLADAVAYLRVCSEALAEPSAYLVGFILGKMSVTSDEGDLDLRTAKRENTILGSPAYARAASEYAGAFSAGKERGLAAVDPNVPDQILPRVLEGISTVANLDEVAAALAS